MRFTINSMLFFYSMVLVFVIGCGSGPKIPSVHEPLDSADWRICAGLDSDDGQFVGLIDEIKAGKHRSILCQGVVLASEGKTKEALDLFTEASVKDKTDHRPHYLAGRVLVEMGRYEEAIAAFERSKERFPNIEVPSERIARKVMAASGDSQALDFLSKVNTRKMCPYGCKGLYAKLLHKAGNDNKANEIYNEMIKNNLDEPSAYVGLAGIHNFAGDYLTESELLTKATKAKNFKDLSDKQKADIYYSHAFSRYNASKYKGAAKALDRAMKLISDRADWWVLAGWIHLKLKNPAVALTMFEKAATIDGSLAAAHVGRGDCIVALGRPGDAIPPYERARINDKKNTIIILKLAYAKAVKGDVAATKQLLDEAMAIDKEHLLPDLLKKITDLLPYADKKNK